MVAQRRFIPRPRRTLDRGDRLELSLRQALIIRREKRLKGWRD
jgi:hypothetical protein